LVSVGECLTICPGRRSLSSKVETVMEVAIVTEVLGKTVTVEATVIVVGGTGRGANRCQPRTPTTVDATISTAASCHLLEVIVRKPKVLRDWSR